MSGESRPATAAGLRRLRYAELEVIGAGLKEVLALHINGFQPVEVIGGEEIFERDGRFYAREAALTVIRLSVQAGQGRPFPAEWNGPLEGGEADDKQL